MEGIEDDEVQRQYGLRMRENNGWQYAEILTERLAR